MPDINRYLSAFILLLSAALARAETADHKTWLNQLSAAALQPSQAAVRYQQRLQRYPDWHRGRLELARLEYKRGRFKSARRLVRKVVTEARMPAVVQKNVLAFYNRILEAEAAAPGKTFNASQWHSALQLSLSSGYDSNANSGPEDQDIGLKNIRLKQSALEKSDHFTSTQLQLRNLRRFDSGLTWHNQLSLLHRRYDTIRHSDITSARISSRVQATLSRHWQAGTSLSFTHRNYGSGSATNNPAIEPFLQWRDGDQKLRAQLRHEPRRYSIDNGNDRDGRSNELALSYYYRLNDRWNGVLSGRLLDTGYDDRRYNYEACEASLQINYAASPVLYFSGQLRQRNTQYDLKEKPLYPDARDERYITARLAVRYRVTDNLTLALRLSHYDNQANHPLHAYDRQQAELKLSWNDQGN